jgi:hypothetical protein
MLGLGRAPDGASHLVPLRRPSHPSGPALRRSPLTEARLALKILLPEILELVAGEFG